MKASEDLLLNFGVTSNPEKRSKLYFIACNVCLAINVPLKLIFDSLHCGSLGSSVVRAPFMRWGCRGFESRLGHLIFSSICSVYIDRRIRVDLSDDEHMACNVFKDLS